MATRLERSRPTKRPMAVGTYSTGTQTLTITAEPARMPRLDPKGYPTNATIPRPTLVDVTDVA